MTLTDENGRLYIDSVLNETFGERIKTHWIDGNNNSTTEKSKSQQMIL